jgi:CHAT domain-containing protein
MKNLRALIRPITLFYVLLTPAAVALPQPKPAAEKTDKSIACCTLDCLQQLAGQPDLPVDHLYAAAECLLGQGEHQAVAAALEALESQVPKGCDLRFSLYRLLGKAHRNLENLNQSIAYLKKAVHCAEALPAQHQPARRLEVYQLAGLNLYDKEDYLLAIEYFGIGLEIIKRHKLNQQAEAIALRQNLGNCYGFLGKYPQARKNFELALGLAHDYQDYSAHQTARLQIYRDMGLMYQRLEQNDKARHLLYKSIRLSTKLYGKNGLETAKGLEILSHTYYQEGQYDKALKYARLAFQGFSASYGKNSPQAARLLAQIGACLTGLGQFERAGRYLDQALSIMRYDPDHNHLFESFETSHRQLAAMLYFKALNHQKAFDAGQPQAHLHQAGILFNLATRLVEFIKNSLEDSGVKPYLLNDFYHVFEGAINNCYTRYQQSKDLKDIEEAFAYAERSKAILLKEAVQKAGAETRQDIPNALLAHYRQLKQEVIRLENQRYEHYQRGDEDLAQELNSQVFQAKRAYYLLEDSLMRSFPAYYRLKQGPTPLTLAEIQIELLAPGQALVQYFAGKERIFIFTITPGQAFLTSVATGESLDSTVWGLRESIYGWLAAQTEEPLGRYQSHAHHLYLQLIAPIEPLLPKRLIIIPDGVLEYLPFEALLSEMPGPATSIPAYPYLLSRYQISYAHSARLLMEMKARSPLQPHHYRALAFAPSFSASALGEETLDQRRISLGRLYSNEEEVMHVKNILNAQVRKGKSATRERFLQEAHLYSILHLATHAKANDVEGDYSYLAFTPTPGAKDKPLLYAKDLYALRLPAEMAVLSACETGIGELRRGEGAISLARGFAYAGTRSLVSTLWRVSDQETAAFMRLFYQNLQQQLPKDEAMHQAKLAYLAEAPPQKAHPFFWAAFTLSGDMSPIITPAASPRWPFYLLGAAGLLAATGLWRRFGARSLAAS